jgi:hypothetical protein
MERTDESGAAISAGGVESPITLLYVRPLAGDYLDLDAKLLEVAERYAPMVRLLTLTPAEAGRVLARRAWHTRRAPSVVVLRHGQVVGEAMGSLLPARELDRVVRRAVEWPHFIAS